MPRSNAPIPTIDRPTSPKKTWPKKQYPAVDLTAPTLIARLEHGWLTLVEAAAYGQLHPTRCGGTCGTTGCAMRRSPS
jgi:hypothetical protein